MDFRSISFFDTVDMQAYQARGHMDAVLREWIGVCFVIAPLLICGIILLLGYGKSIGNWVKHGYYKKDEDN